MTFLTSELPQVDYVTRCDVKSKLEHRRLLQLVLLPKLIFHLRVKPQS